MVGWHHQLSGHEFEQAPAVGDGQGSMACCSPWGHKESDMTEQLNNKMPMYKVCVYYTPRCVYKCVYMYMYVHKHFCICMWICMHV